MIAKHLNVFLFSILTCFAQAVELQVNADAKVYYSTSSGAYLESYLNVYAGSLAFPLNADSLPQAEVEITQILSIQDSIIAFKKYKLKSLAVEDSVAHDILDQQRFAVPNNETIQVEISVRDLHASDTPVFNQTYQHTIALKTSSIFSSDLELLQAYQSTDTATAANEFVKSGVFLLPLVDNFYSEIYEKLAFYQETYNVTSESPQRMLIRYYIETFEHKRKLAQFSKQQKKEIETASPLLGVFNIIDLPTGNYNLVVEAYNTTGEQLFQKKQFFQRRSNNYSDPNLAIRMAQLETQTSFVQSLPQDSLVEFCQFLVPIADNREIDFINYLEPDSRDSLVAGFFYYFWQQRHPEDPERAWRAYKEEVDYVNAQFSNGLNKGYRTDRGRIYLKYGPPNETITREHEPSSYPYEIWFYHKAANFSNRKFIFYNPSLLTGHYETLHSDMPGEVNNPRWEMELNRRNTISRDLDQTQPDGHVGGSAREFFDMNGKN